MTQTVRLLQPSQYLTQAATAVLINGGSTTRYPGNPPLVQVAALPMANLLLANRYLPWQHPGGGGAVPIDFDLGGNKTVGLLAVLALGPTPGSSGPLNCNWGYKLGTATSPAFGYDGTFTDLTPTIGTITLNTNRDAVVVLPATISARYIRCTLNFIPANPFTIGLIVAGGAPTDIGTDTYFGNGQLYSPGSSRFTVRARALNRSPGGIPLFTELGRPRMRYVYRFEEMNDALRSFLISFASGALGIDPWILVAPDQEDCQVVPAANENEIKHTWGPPGAALYTGELVMESLP